MAKLEPVVIDLESFWSQEHSLTKMNPIAYVMHPETEIISAAAKTGGRHTCVTFGEEVIAEDLKHFPWHDKLVIGHNMSMFDAMILAWRFGVKPAMWACTLAMARPIHAKTTGLSLAKLVEHYGIGKKDQTALINTKGRHLKDFTAQEVADMGTYNKADVDQCWELFKVLLPLTSKREMKIIDMTIRMLTEPGFELDIPLLEKTLAEERARKKTTLVNLAHMTGAYLPGMTDDEAADAVCSTLGSAAKFGKLLNDLGVETPVKISKTTGKPTPALAKTDQEFVALTKSHDPIVAAAANARLGVKSTLLESRIETFLEVGKACGGMKPIAINYYGADTTGRDSGGMSMNDQNLPRVNPSKPKPTDALRMSLRAPKGMKVVVADLSGIELRTNMFLWQVPYAMELFRNDPEKADLYRYFAAHELYHKDMDDITKDERQLGKVCLAEGTLVLTDSGLKPIETVTPSDLLWDGIEWVCHDGAVYVGEKETIHHDGIDATPDHEVWVEDGRKIPIGVAAAQSLRLARSGDGRTPLGFGGAGVENCRAPQGAPLCSGEVLAVRDSENGFVRQPKSREDSGVPVLQAEVRSAEVAYSAIGVCPTAMHESQRPGVPQVRWSGCGVQLPFGGESCGVGDAEHRSGTREGVGPSGQQCRVCSGEPEMGNSPAEYGEPAGVAHETVQPVQDELSGSSLRRLDASSVDVLGVDGRGDSRALCEAVGKTKRRVWDILNAGPRNRFTANDRLVSNCHLGLGFGAGGATFQRIAKTMGGIDMDKEASFETVRIYREAHPEIAGRNGGWRRCASALQHMLNLEHFDIDPWGLCHTVPNGIKSPQGMIRYPDLRKETVVRNQGTPEEREESAWVYGQGRHKAFLTGPKVTENIVQHLAREVVMDNALEIKRVTGYGTKHRVHDELIYVVPESEAEDMLAEVQRIMRTPPKWWPELVVWSEGDIGNCYGEAK